MLVGCVRTAAMRTEGWWRARTAHVVLTADLGEGGTREAAAIVERTHQALEHAFYHCGHDEGVAEVTLFAHDEDYLALEGEGTRGRTLRGVSGMVALPRRIVVRHAILEPHVVAGTLAHELTHDRVAACFPDAPRWLHEGLATVFETIYLEDGHVIVGAPPYRFADRGMFDREDAGGVETLVVPSQLFVPPSALVRMDADAFYAEDDAVQAGHYASAWLLTHYLALGPDAGMRAAFLHYLDAMAAGREREAVAFELSFDVHALDRAATSYRTQRRYQRVARPFVGAETEVALEAIAPGDAELLLLELALRSDADLVAGEHRARLELDPSRRRRASLLERALAADLTAREALDASLRAELARAEARGEATIEELHALAYLAETETERARVATRLAAHPDRRAVDLAVVAELELDARRIDDADAHVTEALALDPRCAHAWLIRGRVAVERGDARLARRAFHVVTSFEGHGGPLSAEAWRWLRRIP